MNRRLSVNRYLCDGSLPFPAFAEAAGKAGLSAVGVTRAALAELGARGLSRCLREHGLSVSSLNSAGYFTSPDAAKAMSDGLFLIDAAAEIGAEVLCVIAGGVGWPPRPAEDARRLVADGFAPLYERAAAAGVRLGVEPIHPSGIVAKGCINSLAQALDFVAPYPEAALIVDLAHSWWDPDLRKVFEERPEAVALLQVCNVRFENGIPTGRDTLAAGSLALADFLPGLLDGAYDGRVELELFETDLAGRDPLAVIERFPAEFSELFACRI